MKLKYRVGALATAALAILGMSSVPSRAADAPVAAPTASPAPTAPPAPFVINGRHIFWADGVRTVADADPSAALNNLIYHGGAIQHSPKVYVTFWGSEWTDRNSADFTIPLKDKNGKSYTLARLQTYIVNFFKGIGGTGWNNIQTQYCQGGQIGDLSCDGSEVSVRNVRNVLAGVWNDTNPADEPLPVIDTLGLAENVVPDPVATEALAASQHFKTTDPDATFFVFAPPGRTVTGSSPFGAYCGYHTEVTPTNGQAHGIRYAFIPYILDTDLSPTASLGGCGMNFVNKTNEVDGRGAFDGFSIVSGHEYAEAVTDPDGYPFQDGWNDVQTSENGDKCAWITSGQGAAQDIRLSTGKFAVQSMWSNAFDGGTGGCVISYP